MQIRVWVEVFGVERYQESVQEVDDAVWEAMSQEERDEYGARLFDDMRNEIANGGWEVDE